MKKSKNKRIKAQSKVSVQLVRSELASSVEYQMSRGYSDIARPDDDILKKHGYNVKIYRSLLSDEQVKACYLNQRIAGVIAAPWSIIPAGDAPQDEEIAEFVKNNLERLNFNEICRKMLYATWYGFQVGEIIWGVEAGKNVIADIKVRNIERFNFKNTGELYLIRNYSEKELMPDRKFWVVKNSGDNDDDIYGLGLAHVCYWPVYLKRNGLKFWSILVEKFAVPTAVGKYPQLASNEVIKKVLSALDSIATETSIAVPEGTEVQLLEAVKSSGGDHEKFCKYLDQILAKAILGQDGTSENGRYAGTAAVQENVKDLILKSDADLLCESFNRVIAWLVAWNWPEAQPPKLTRSFEVPENLKEAAEQDSIICGMGFKPTLKHIQDKYGGEWQEASSAPVQAGAGAEFAETEDDTPLDEATDELAEDWEEVLTPMLEPVEKLAQNCTSYEEFGDRLLEAYPEMDAAKLTESLAKAQFRAKMNARAGVKKHG